MSDFDIWFNSLCPAFKRLYFGLLQEETRIICELENHA